MVSYTPLIDGLRLQVFSIKVCDIFCKKLDPSFWIIFKVMYSETVNSQIVLWLIGVTRHRR